MRALRPLGRNDLRVGDVEPPGDDLGSHDVLLDVAGTP